MLEILLWILIYAIGAGAIAGPVHAKYLKDHAKDIHVQEEAITVACLAGFFWPFAMAVLLGLRISAKFNKRFPGADK
jgi:pheromone shutdown protein TraB